LNIYEVQTDSLLAALFLPHILTWNTFNETHFRCFTSFRN